MLYVFKSNIKPGQLKAVQEWAQKNENALNESYPDSWQLDGIYFPAFGFGGLHVEIHWRIKGGYAAFDELCSAGSRLDGGPLTELYCMLDNEGSSEARLLKSASDKATLVISD